MTEAADNMLGADIAGLPDLELLAELQDLIVRAEKERPRSLQRALGPSGVAHECQRRLAYMTVRSRIEVPEGYLAGPNTYNDPLAAIFGTAMHTWMEEAVRKANERHKQETGSDVPIWIPEAKVTVREGLTGSCDLYHVPSGSVLDWKFPGTTRYAHYKKHGPSNTYRGQAHLYGRGYRNFGLPVNHVGIVFISRTGTLRQMHLWREPYDDGYVDDILARLDRVEEHIEELSISPFNPAGFKQIPIAPDDDCDFCPWHSVNPQNAFQCGGKEEVR